MDVRRKRLLFRARHMGTVENDNLVGGFAEQHLSGFSNDQLDRFENLLKQNDTDLFLWAIGARQVPPEHDHDVMRLLREFSAAHRQPESA